MPQDSEKDRASFLKAAQTLGLLESRPVARPELHCTEAGVSLTFLRRLAQAYELDKRHTETTATFVAKAVLPLTKARKCRFFDLVAPEHTGKPSYYVVHAWGTPFKQLVEQLVCSLTKVEEDQPKVVESSIFLWIDIFALNQHPHLNGQADIMAVKDLVKVCTQGAAVVMDRQLLCLSRLWCAYEMWTFVNYGDVTSLKVCLPEPVTVEYLERYEAKIRQQDVMRLETSRQEDKARLLSEIKGSVGVKIMQKSYQDSLVLNVRAHLRWTKDLRHLGLYCALLLKENELTHLQTVLHGIPELQDDEKTLREIEQIFLTYVSSHEDELDITAFTQVLAAAGFDESEARTIFAEVNEDDSGGVGIDEFKGWWLTSQRQENNKRKAPLHFTSEALTENLTRMHALLQREGVNDVASAFKTYLDGVHEGRLLRPGVPLPTSPLKGEWHNSVDQVSWKLHNHDYRSAASLMYDVLMWNGDMLSIPPHQLPHHDKQHDYVAFFKVLALYLDMFGRLLLFQPGRKQHADYYIRFSRELSSPMVASLLADAQKSSTPASHAKLDFERFTVVRDMIGLKYGDSQPIHHSLIVEAEKSLASWMAGNRRSSAAVGGASDGRAKLKDSLGSLAADYLGSHTSGGWGLTVGKGANDGAVVTIPNAAKRPNVRRSSAFIGETESVLTRLGPDALAFLHSQQQGAGGGGGARGAAAAAASRGTSQAGAPAQEAATAGSPKAGGSEAGAGSGQGEAAAASAGVAAATTAAADGGGGVAGGRARRGSMLAVLEGSALAAVLGGGAFGQVQKELQRVGAAGRGVDGAGAGASGVSLAAASAPLLHTLTHPNANDSLDVSASHPPPSALSRSFSRSAAGSPAVPVLSSAAAGAAADAALRATGGGTAGAGRARRASVVVTSTTQAGGGRLGDSSSPDSPGSPTARSGQANKPRRGSVDLSFLGHHGSLHSGSISHHHSSGAAAAGGAAGAAEVGGESGGAEHAAPRGLPKIGGGGLGSPVKAHSTSAAMGQAAHGGGVVGAGAGSQSYSGPTGAGGADEEGSLPPRQLGREGSSTVSRAGQGQVALPRIVAAGGSRG